MRFNVLPCQDCCGPQLPRGAAGLFSGSGQIKKFTSLLIFDPLGRIVEGAPTSLPP